MILKYDSVCTKVGKMAVMVAFGTSVEFKPVYIKHISTVFYSHLFTLNLPAPWLQSE